MRVVIYARKSSESVDRQVQSLDDQLLILQNLAASEGYLIVETIRESKSAKDPGERPEFARLLRLAESGKIDGILTWHINRLTRNMVDGGRIAHLLHAGQIRFIRTPERTFRPEDNVLIIAIENATATNFIHDLTKNVARGMNSKAQKGWFPGRAPLGYRNNTLTNEIEPDPERFHLVRQGWDMLLSGGTSLASVYRQLVDSGLTMYGRGSIKRPLRQKSSYDIFSNIFYVGQFRFRGELYPGAHKPMVTLDEFKLVQHLLSPKTPRSLERVNTPTYSGIFRCTKCGAQIVADIKRKVLKSTGEAVEYTYYRCSGARGCDKRGMREELVTERVLQVLESIKITPPQALWCKQVLARNFEQHASDSAVAVAEAQYAADNARKRLDKLTMLYIDGGVGKEEYDRAKSTLQQEAQDADARSIRLRNRDMAAMSWVERKFTTALKCSYFEGGNTELRRTVLATLGETPKMSSEWVELNVCPILQKIASFEPTQIGSWKQKTPSKMESAFSWGAWAEAIRTEVYEQIDHAA